MPFPGKTGNFGSEILFWVRDLGWAGTGGDREGQAGMDKEGMGRDRHRGIGQSWTGQGQDRNKKGKTGKGTETGRDGQDRWRWTEMARDRDRWTGGQGQSGTGRDG